MRGGARSPGARWESEPQYPNRSATPHAAHGQPQLPYMNFLGQRPRGHLDSATYRSRRRRGALPRRRAAAGGGVSRRGGGYAAGPARARLMETPPLRASRGFGATSARPWLPLAGAAAAQRGLRGRGWWRRRHRGPLGPWAGGIEAPPRLLRGRCTRRGLRVRGWWERRHCGPLGPWAGAYCGSGARGGACMGAAGGNTATAGPSARWRGALGSRRASCRGDARGGACVGAAGGETPSLRASLCLSLPIISQCPPEGHDDSRQAAAAPAHGAEDGPRPQRGRGRRRPRDGCPRGGGAQEPSEDTCGGLAGHPPRAGARRGDTQCCLLHGPL
jgi:hypothetical protein